MVTTLHPLLEAILAGIALIILPLASIICAIMPFILPPLTIWAMFSALYYYKLGSSKMAADNHEIPISKVKFEYRNIISEELSFIS